MEPPAAGSANKPVDCKAGSAAVVPNKEPPKRNPFNIADDEIKHQIFKAHDNTYGPFVADSLFIDADFLFIIVQNILNRSTQIVDDLVIKGYGKVPPAKIDEFKNVPNIKIPMCILKDIRLELSCYKDPQPETAHERTLIILSKLKAYSWEASAVLTLAAFALEFVDFSDLVELEKSNVVDPLSTSLAILRGAPNLTKTQEILTARKEEVVALNKLIKETLELMDTIFKLKKLSPVSPKEVDIYWIMLSVIAFGTKISTLACEKVKPLDLSHYAEKIKSILDTRKGQLKDLNQREAEGEFFSYLVKISKMPSKVPKFLGKLFFGRDYTDHVQNILDASNNYKKVGVDVLAGKSKTLFILISYLNISDDDRQIVQQIQSKKITNDPKLQEQYGIVWMPIVEENPPESNQKPAKGIESLVKNQKMEGYIVHPPVSHQAALMFLKEEWSFKGSPIVVIKDEKEKIYVNCNSFYTISLLGIEAFPFDQQKVNKVIDEMKWIVPLFKDSSEEKMLQGWVNKERDCYIFIFGGKADNWAKDMEEKRKTILKELNPDNSKTGPTIKLFDVEKTLNSPSAKDRFWKGVEGLFTTKINEADHKSKHQIQRLYSYKREDQGWFALNKGDKTIVVGNRDTFMKMMQDFAEWSVNLRGRDFAVVFRDQHESTLEVIKATLKCSYIEIPKDAPKLKEGIKCPECGLDMGISVTYDCCHKSN